MFRQIPALLTCNPKRGAFLCLLLLGLVLFSAAPILANGVTLAWDPNNETDLAGYKLYFKTGTPGSPYDGGGIDGKASPIDIPISALTDPSLPELQLNGLAPNTDFYFVVTAYTASNIESGFSNEVTYTTGPATHTITAQAGANGTISPAGTVSVAPGGSQTFMIAPNTGYHVLNVAVDGQSLGPETTYTFDNVTGDHSIAATFGIDTYTIDASAEGSGSISPAGSTTTSYGQDQTYTITPAQGYHIADVIVDGSSVGAVGQYTFSSIAEPHTIHARFDVNTYTISARYGENGAISPAGNTIVEHGASLTYSFKPNANYHVSDVLIDGISAGPIKTYTFSDISDNHTISVAFEIDSFSISLSAGENGATDPANTVSVAYGSDLTVQIIPDANHLISDVIVDGVSVGAVSSYTLSGIHADHTIAASFEKDPDSGQFVLETGEILADHQWQRVALKKNFTTPVVVANTFTTIDDSPATLRIRNVDPSGFDIRVQEWSYLDGTHEPEKVGYIVMESGSFTLDNGFMVEARVVETANANTFGTLLFAQPFQEPPVVMTAIVSVNDPEPATGRMKNIYRTGFDYRMQEQELNTQNHGMESVAYIAWEPSSGIIDGLSYEVNRTGDAVAKKFKTVELNQNFTEEPVFLAEMQTANGGDPSNVRLGSKTMMSAEVQIDEEQSSDNEVNHTTEVVGYMAFMQEAVVVDSDGDGLNDPDEQNVYQTDPQKADTDADGIDDGDEVNYWGEAWNGDADADGVINLLDADADGDGILDGDEIANGTDPGVAEPVDSSPEVLFGTTEINHNWKRIELNQAFTDPVVVAGPIGSKGSAPAVIRIRNVDSTGFDIRVQEWEYLDGTHILEPVSYMVMERGHHTLANGVRVEAGTFTAVGDDRGHSMQFAQEFQTTPVVVMAVTSFNDADVVTHRISNITVKGSEYRLQEQEANDQIHATEEISYIAWEPSAGTLKGYAYEVGRTENTVRHDPFNIMYSEPTAAVPMFLADMQTKNGSDPSNLRMDNMDNFSVDVLVDEESSYDEETWHGYEVVGYFIATPLDQ